jgi:hypothetical protein
MTFALCRKLGFFEKSKQTKTKLVHVRVIKARAQS